MRVHEIVPGKLFISGEPASPPTRADWAALERAGITAVLNLTTRDNAVLRRQLGGAYHRVTLSDGARVDPALVEAAVHQVHVWLGDRLRVLVHCHAGRNRSALVAARVAQRLLGLTGDEAVAHVRARRPRALANSAGEAYLRAQPRPRVTYAEQRALEVGTAMNVQRKLGIVS